MNDPERIRRIARTIFTSNIAQKPFQPLRGENAPASLEEAYLIQDEVYRLFQEETDIGPLGGYKIALTSKAVQDLCGVHQPVGGCIFATTIRRSPQVLHASDMSRVALEFELAVEMARDVPASNTPHTRTSMASYVGAIMPAFELIEDRLADYSDLDAASILTDRCWCAGVVLGEPIHDWQAIDLSTCPAALTWNGEVVDRGVTGDSMGHPFEGLAWVANHLAGRGRNLATGDIVITGSALKTQYAQVGDRVTYCIEGLGETTVTIAA